MFAVPVPAQGTIPGVAGQAPQAVPPVILIAGPQAAPAVQTPPVAGWPTVVPKQSVAADPPEAVRGAGVEAGPVARGEVDPLEVTPGAEVEAGPAALVEAELAALGEAEATVAARTIAAERPRGV
ncbi:hypothetical protein OSTOST_12492 [Ostertagia ostertagi]